MSSNKNNKNFKTDKNNNLNITTKTNIKMSKKLYKGGKIEKPYANKIIISTILFIILIRILVTLIPSYKVDMGGYRAWSLYLADRGFKGLYETFHIVYAPAYMYLLWISGKITRLLSLDMGGLEFLIKAWAGLFDILGAYIIYLIAKKYGKQRIGFLLGFIYSINPGVFFNSSIWGQFDSIPATLLLLVVYFFNTRRKAMALIVFTIAVLTKPQSGLLAPLVLIAFFRGFTFRDIKHLKRLLYTFIGGVFIYISSVLPVYDPTPFLKSAQTTSFFTKAIYQIADLFYWIIHLYRTSINDYPYATANAFNIWTILGGQPVMDTEPFWGLTFSKWGFILLAFALTLATVLFLKKKNSAKALYFSSYLLLFGSFMFATRMHERYLLPALIFITVGIIWDKRLWIPMIILSLCVLANHWYLYALSFKNKFWLSNYDKFAMTIAIITLIIMIYSVYYAVNLIRSKDRYNIKKVNL